MDVFNPKLRSHDHLNYINMSTVEDERDLEMFHFQMPKKKVKTNYE